MERYTEKFWIGNVSPILKTNQYTATKLDPILAIHLNIKLAIFTFLPNHLIMLFVIF